MEEKHMKRTGEIILTVIGLIINGLMALGLAFFIPVLQSEKFKQELENQMQGDPAAEQVDPNQIMDWMSNAGWTIVIATAIGFVLGLIAIFCLKGNKKPKVGGILLILGAVISGLVSFGAAFFPAILYLVGGIMALARKPKKLLE